MARRIGKDERQARGESCVACGYAFEGDFERFPGDGGALCVLCFEDSDGDDRRGRQRLAVAAAVAVVALCGAAAVSALVS